MGWPRGRNAGSTTTSQASHARGAKKEKENRGRANRLSFSGALARRRFEPTSDKKPSDGHSGSQTRLEGWGHAPVAFRPWGRLEAKRGDGVERRAPSLWCGHATSGDPDYPGLIWHAST